METGPKSEADGLIFGMKENTVFRFHSLAAFAGKLTIYFELLIPCKDSLIFPD